ncbi:MAG: phenylalanine--tRNA ligase subunit beta [Salinivirgaceae bacterium]|jgi:phenylalanyl-tRNA synthetase beta chain|nr:phenylalanine--tRNA ligase subunit beta [Salinivirgaceae bacterium]
MKISYNWLKEYINIDLEPAELAEILTDTGLEVGGIEEFESVKGGLKGLVIGEVKTCTSHSNSDHLSLTTVDLGDGNDAYPIVCGAPNVAAGQKVVVATVGTTLYNGTESFVIKKSKIRGEISLGMICAEDEIGVGRSHDGIMVLPDDAKVGTPAKDYFNIENDTIIEIDLTPNRIDGGSHIGVARDIAAYLKQTQAIEYTKKSVDAFKVDNTDLTIPVDVQNAEACPRYAGVTMSGLTVKESPEWLQNRLKAIGLSPINNVVDVTNYVLHEVGQPLHAFDASKIKGNKVFVKTMKKDTKFTTLDEENRELHEDDLMICNAEESMCIAGVFGGIESGVTENSTSIFIESAYFNPVYVRKTARRHGLNTDASFRFERGVDPNSTIYALKRAALLIKEVAGGTISSNIVDEYPNPVADFNVKLRLSQLERLIGEKLPKEKVVNILEGLEIKIAEDKGEEFELLVPPYRVDVQREADVIEEILRIYGYNTVPISDVVNSTLAYVPKPDPNELKELIANQLSGIGFNEMMANSLTKVNYHENIDALDAENTVRIFNPLSQDLNGMRQTLLFGALETVAFNSNRQNPDLKLFEFGNCYTYNSKNNSENSLDKYNQLEKLSILVSGNRNPESWSMPTESVSFFSLKSHVENVLQRLGVKIERITSGGIKNDLFSEGLVYVYNNVEIAKLGLLSKKIRKQFDIKQEVFYAELEWEKIMKAIRKHKVEFVELPKYPEVRRDLSLLLDKTVPFNDLKVEAFKSEKKLLKQVDLFDVYEGKNLDKNKKSYALSFIIADETKTLKDKQIDKIMHAILKGFEDKFGAIIR